MPDRDFPRLVNETKIALQVCTAGNLRTCLLDRRIAEERQSIRTAADRDRYADRQRDHAAWACFIRSRISRASPKIPVEWAIAAATGNNADVYRLNSGYLRPGRDADVAVIDACAGGSQDNALDALRNGDIAAVAAVISDGVPRFVGRSRNTPGPIKNVRVADCKLPRDFTGGLH